VYPTPKLKRVPVCVRVSERVWRRTKFYSEQQARPLGYLVDDALRHYFKLLREEAKEEQEEIA
jgi:hypothetical protein